LIKAMTDVEEGEEDWDMISNVPPTLGCCSSRRHYYCDRRHTTEQLAPAAAATADLQL
jgi:hypothetical protein